VLVLLLPDVHLQDMAGPVQVLYEASRLGGAYQLSYCAARPQVTSAQGLVLSNLLHPPPARRGDLVIVPGVSSDALDRLEHVPAGWLREAHAAGARIPSVHPRLLGRASRVGTRGRRAADRPSRLREEAMTRTLVRNALAAMHLTKRSQMIGMGSAVSQALVGAWRLVSSEFRLSSGEVIHPYGTDAVGLLIYSVDGLMSAQIMRSGRLVIVAAAFPARVGGHSVATPSPPSFSGASDPTPERDAKRIVSLVSDCAGHIRSGSGQA